MSYILVTMKLRHYDNDGRARFITFCTHKRIPMLTNNRFRSIALSAIKATRVQFNFQLIAWVIMPEHIHLILIPCEGSRVGKIIGEIKRQSAREILAILRRSKASVLSRLTVSRTGSEKIALWQRRCYDHNVRSEESLWEKVSYCHNNPVKRGLVQKPEDWEWSSFRLYRQGTESESGFDENLIES